MYEDVFTALGGMGTCTRSRHECIILKFIPKRFIYIHDMCSYIFDMSNVQLP